MTAITAAIGLVAAMSLITLYIVWNIANELYDIEEKIDEILEELKRK